MDIDENELMHYGTPRHSGRYPWGSGKNPQRNKSFLTIYRDLHDQGLSDKEIAESMGMNVTSLRAQRSIANSQQRAADATFATKLYDKGLSKVAIGKIMDKNESSVRNLLNEELQARSNKIQATTDMLKEEIKSKKYIDVGKGTETRMNVSSQMLKNAVTNLKQEGYSYINLPVTQRGTGFKTNVVVLAKPGTTFKEVLDNEDKIGVVNYKYDADDLAFKPLGLKDIKDFPSKKVAIRYAEDGGTNKDGVIELRRGVPGLDLGDAKYAQVRISVDGTHYLKGMAMYGDDLPNGCDILFNTNKSKSVPMLSDDSGKSVLKSMKSDPDNPFGTSLKLDDDLQPVQKGYLNIVREEGDWDSWSKNMAAQMLSKQPVSLAKKQLGLASDAKKSELKEIESYTNPIVKQKLLLSFADGCDYDAEHLQAKSMPRQATKVLLPCTKVKEGEIYAPTFNNGESVVLIRFPHGGKFEIPQLTVNNNNREAKKIIGSAKDAVGINHKTASILSGADFDGDTVVIIPNNDKLIKRESPLKKLENFDPSSAYPAYEGMPKVGPKTGFNKGTEMGIVTNLITDMTLRGGYTETEISNAIKHSMVVIDAEKHNLNYKQSAIDNNIEGLKKKYQPQPNKSKGYGGASTLISKSRSEERVPKRSMRYSIDPKTGEKIYYYTGETYINSKGKTILRTTKSTQMAEASDAYSLSSGTAMESVYANYANEMKALGNTARKESLSSKGTQRSSSAAKVYSKEVESLNTKLMKAKYNAPLERKAQIMAGSVVYKKKQSNPDMDRAEIKKIGNQALANYRSKLGAKKETIDITGKEWEAIQANAISPSKVSEILDNADLEQVKELAMPRESRTIPQYVKSRAKSLIASGYTQSEVSSMLGISVATVNSLV